MKPLTVVMFSTVLSLLATPVFAQLACDKGNGYFHDLACKDGEVKALIHQVSIEAARQHCKPAQKTEFAEALQAWGRFNCSFYTDDMKACVIRQMNDEVAYLKGINQCDVASHPAPFKGANPSYVLDHPGTFDNVKTNVFGQIALESCDEDSTSVNGVVKQYRNESKVLAIHFKSMSAGDRRFLCEKRPYSSWEGTVMLDSAGVPYIYATRILGPELP